MKEAAKVFRFFSFVLRMSRPAVLGFVVMILPVSTGIGNRIVPKWGSVMRTTRCRCKLHIGPLIGDCMLDELSTCYLARR